MRYKIIQKNDGPFRMYQLVDTHYNDQVVMTTSKKEEADDALDLHQWDWENRDN